MGVPPEGEGEGGEGGKVAKPLHYHRGYTHLSYRILDARARKRILSCHAEISCLHSDGNPSNSLQFIYNNKIIFLLDCKITT